MFNNAVGRLRVIGFIEGLSYIILLAIAMPLKYFADFPQAVSIVGMLHGIFFVLFVLASIHVFFVKRWSILKFMLAFLSSLIPFGTFVLDKQLRREQ